MTTFIKKLSEDLTVFLKSADEIWIAVALIKRTGLKIIQDHITSTCKQNYLIGIDLPTDPQTLHLLHKSSLKSDIKARVFTDKEYFHPKLYLLRTDNKYIGFIGSANCTSGGLHSNIEVSVSIDDQKTCKELKEWFEESFNRSNLLTKKFIASYAKDYKKRIERKKEDSNQVKKEKGKLKKDAELTFSNKNNLIKVLKSYRASEAYKKDVKERNSAVEKLRSSLDYPLFKKIDLDYFFSIWELGHLISISKPLIKRQTLKLRKLLLVLCNEQIDIASRYDAAIGTMKVTGISDATISKILTLHRPDLYFVKNSKTEKALEKYGIDLPSNLTEGEKYEIICQALRQICKDVRIKDLAVLDLYLYREGDAE